MDRHSFLPALVLVLTGLMLMSMSHSARACVCGLIEPDAAYQNAFLVFTGTVEKVTELTRDIVHEGKPAQTFDGRIARITVDEYFKGTGGAEIELHGGNTSCDIGFEVGKRYIFYAIQDGQTGELGAFKCSRTRLLDDYAKPDISYLRRATRGERPAMLTGHRSCHPISRTRHRAPARKSLLSPMGHRSMPVTSHSRSATRRSRSVGS